jgi:type I restriction enzyme R subunit
LELSEDEVLSNHCSGFRIYDRITEQNRRDALLRAKYEHDEKFTRVHKRIKEQKPDWKVISINQALLGIKHDTDERIMYQNALLDNESFFARDIQPLVIRCFNSNALRLDTTAARQINELVVSEYMKEYRGTA